MHCPIAEQSVDSFDAMLVGCLPWQRATECGQPQLTSMQQAGDRSADALALSPMNKAFKAAIESVL